MDKIRNTLLLCTFVFLIGCTTIPTFVNVPNNEPHSIIRGDWVGLKALIGFKTHTVIIGIDGIKALGDCKISPGVHTIQVSVGTSNRSWHDEFEMNFEAGKNYQVQAHKESGTYMIKIYDENEIIVFTKPLEPKGGRKTTYIPVFI